MLLKVAEKKVNAVLVKKAEAERMMASANESMKKVTGELYDVAEGMRGQADDLESQAKNLEESFN